MRPMNARCWIGATLVGVLFAIHLGCGESPAIPQDSPAPWDSTAVREVEKEWQSLSDAYDKTPERIPGDPGKDKYGRLEGMFDDLFRKRLSNSDLRTLARSIGATPDRAFVDRLAQFMARTFVDSGDRDSLLRLLSAKCPGRVGTNWEIEFYLVTYGGKLKDPIRILGEAYSKSESARSRQDLAAAVRRGFAGLGIHGKDDADFVKQAMDWYEKEKGRLIVNRRYGRNAMFVPLEAYEEDPKLYDAFPPGIKREPLFERTATSR